MDKQSFIVYSKGQFERLNTALNVRCNILERCLLKGMKTNRDDWFAQIGAKQSNIGGGGDAAGYDDTGLDNTENHVCALLLGDVSGHLDQLPQAIEK